MSDLMLLGKLRAPLAQPFDYLEVMQLTCAAIMAADKIEKQAAEIAALRGEIESAYVQREADAEIARSEIAALRQFVRWHFMHHPQSWPGFAEIMPAVRRALEEGR